MNKKIIAVFDFDGTITTKDTFVEFVKYSKGVFSCYLGFALFLPLIIAFKLNLYPNYKVKQKIFSFFFKGMHHQDFIQLGVQFQDRINTFLRKDVLDEICDHLRKGHKTYVVTASIYEWVSPWCHSNGIAEIIATKPEVSLDGILTGRFATKNCNGKEKVIRFLQEVSNREDFIIHAYGDSKGDDEMLKFADLAYNI